MKDEKPILTPQQRLTILLHEFSGHYPNEVKRVAVEFEVEQKKYFDNFPFDEQAVRDFLKCKKELGYFKNHDVANDKLSDMLSYPNHQYGFRILNVTVGKGTHNTGMYGGHILLDRNYEVSEGEVYITYNTQQMLSGGKFTVVMERKNGENKLTKSYTHSRS